MYRDPEIFDEYHVGIIRLFLHYVEDFPYVYWEDLDVGSELFDFHMFYIAYMEYALPLRPLPYFILADEIPWVERGSETEFTNNMYQANLGDAFAQFKVGYGYYHGEDVGQNYEEAFKWLMQSEKRVAQHEVGKMLLLGLGVNKDVEEAFKWYMKLAQQGDEVAQYRVGEMLFEGQGVDKNVKEAFAFFKISSANGDDRAKIKLELLGNELDVWIGNTNKLNTNDNQENEDEPLEEKVELSSSDIYQYLIDSLSSMPETSASQQSNKIVVLLHQEELHDMKINLEIK